ncbi:MAG TPA: hypothetical protein VGI22_16735 [Xanthobacteraceae bacterium]
MELRHLRYFVAVAEELNFTRLARPNAGHQPAAAHPADSTAGEGDRRAAFRRQARGVELTSAGKLMLEEARVILKQVGQAKIGVRRRARGEIGQLNIGSSGGTYFHPLIPTIIRQYGTQMSS